MTRCARECELVVTCEEHNMVGGFGSAVAEVMAEMTGKQARLLRIGLEDAYCTKVGSQAYLREECGISAQWIARKIEGALV